MIRNYKKGQCKDCGYREDCIKTEKLGEDCDSYYNPDKEQELDDFLFRQQVKKAVRELDDEYDLESIANAKKRFVIWSFVSLILMCITIGYGFGCNFDERNFPVLLVLLFVFTEIISCDYLFKMRGNAVEIKIK